MNIPRPEHPNPQWMRDSFITLNGEWDFDFDFGRTAAEKLARGELSLSKKIIVPFCPESELSGIGYKDFMPGVVYHKAISLTDEQLKGRVILHFGAADYFTRVWVNDKLVCSHRGGYTPFEADIADAAHIGENYITVICEDDARDGLQCSGKQCPDLHSRGCHYTRVTGIWQSVWLELVPQAYIISARYYTDAENGSITVCGKTCGCGTVEIKTDYKGEPTGSASVYSDGDFTVSVPLSRRELWELGNGRLYNITLTLGCDTVHSYFGLRSVGLDGMKFKLNHKTVFQRTVLDQGYYPDGIYTAPTEEALVRDIEISMWLGFNGARLHEKVFEPRFLYHCDRMGYMVWGEYANWGFDCANEAALSRFLKEWLEALSRDVNHPSIIGWCPFNETWEYVESQHRNELLSTVYRVTKAFDPQRICIDTSGNFHTETDIFDVHDYEQNPEKFASCYAEIDKGILRDQTQRSGKHSDKQKYTGGPVFVSEYGGIACASDKSGWGYGNAPESREAFIERYRGLTDALLDNPNILGFCYTQLYDVEQEQNGLYTYDRKAKFDPKIFREINERHAAIEKA